MNWHKRLICFTIPIFIMVGCSNRINNQAIDRKILIDSLFKELKSLEVDSLRKINAFNRGNPPLRVVRCYYNDSCKYAQILLMRNENNEIAIKLRNRLTTIDSLEYYYPLQKIGFTKERIIYCFKVMEMFSLVEIGTSCEYKGVYYKGLSIEKDNLKFYYLFDTIFDKEYDLDTTLIKLERNWWVEK